MNTIWKSNLPDSLKRDFFRSVVESVLLYGSSTWTLTKKMEKTIDGTYTRMLRAVLNVSWKSHPTKARLYGPLPPVSHTIRVRRLTFAGHCWRSKDEIVSDLILWHPKHGRASRGRPRKTFINQLLDDTQLQRDTIEAAMEMCSKVLVQRNRRHDHRRKQVGSWVHTEGSHQKIATV